MTNQLPPEENEKHVLGAMLLTRKAIDEVVTDHNLQPGDFHSPRHELIYTAITTMHARGEGVDAITLATHLTKAGDLARAGGAPYLHELIAFVPTAANVGYYARHVREQAMHRRMVAAGTRIVQMGSSPEGDIDEKLDLAHAELDTVGRATTTTAWVGDRIDTTIDDLENPAPTIPTPWQDLNHIIGGWSPGRLYVVGARPGVGKTLVATNAAAHLALTTPVAFSTLEMGEPEIHHRLLANFASVNLKHLIEHRVEEDDWQRIAKTQPTIRALRLSIDDRADVTITDIASHARTVARHSDTGIGAVIVDYIQLITPTHTGRKNETREQQVAAVSRRLKLLAKELACPVIALSQLNRASEHRTDKRPTMADLRETGALEQDADVILLLHVEEDDPSTLHVAVAKNRHGITGAFELDRIGHYARLATRPWRPSNAAVA